MASLEKVGWHAEANTDDYPKNPKSLRDTAQYKWKKGKGEGVSWRRFRKRAQKISIKGRWLVGGDWGLRGGLQT